jgi:hypothetical protein
LSFLPKLLGYRPRKYRDDQFSVQIKSMAREGVAVFYKRNEVSLELKGERTGSKWEGIQVIIPSEVEITRVPQMAQDLETALRAMDYEYVIVRGLETLAKSK